jgi:energy-coupling factor transport system substrate-specific component
MREEGKRGRVITYISMAVASVIGLAAFFYPFFLSPASPQAAAGFERSGQASLLFLFLLPVLFIVIFGGVLGRGGTKEIALLGALTAINVTLRFIPLPMGGSAIFFLLILSGYAWGAPFGFLLGSLTILVSSFWAGGLGPWVPFQMIATAWVGMTGGWLRTALKSMPKASSGKLRVALLATFGFVWGYAFGAIMNLWFWPYLGGSTAGSSGVVKYAVFYLATSAFWDTGRAIVNFILLLLLTGPVLKVFDRFKKRFEVEYL